MLERTSAIAANLAAGGRDGADGRRALAIGEVRGWKLVQLGVFAGREAEFAAALGPLLATPLPPPGAVHSSARGRVYCIARDQYWVVSADAALAEQLAAAVDPAVGTATSLSHGRVRIAIRGTAARAMLAKLLSVDLEPQAFAVGQARQTGLHHNGVLCERCADDRYDLYVPRTYAASIWESLVDAALVFGYEIEEMHI
jgi:heterotetrameric sarcosine oxidase gamma subunit